MEIFGAPGMEARVVLAEACTQLDQTLSSKALTVNSIFTFRLNQLQTCVILIVQRVYNHFARMRFRMDNGYFSQRLGNHYLGARNLELSVRAESGCRLAFVSGLEGKFAQAFRFHFKCSTPQCK